MSDGKFIHNSLVFSNDEFKKGFVTAYYSGDGTIDTRTNSIMVTSASYKLLNDLNVMLKTMGIMSYIRKNKKVTTNNRGTKEKNKC